MPSSTLRIWWNFFFNKPADARPPSAFPMHAITHAELDQAPSGSLYRLGHSTVLIKLRGFWWMTDPVFSERASPLPWLGPKRFHAPPITLDQLPPIRGVILSHDHYDHLDRTAIEALVSKTGAFLAPLGVGDRLIAWGVDREKVLQFDWWKGTELDGVRLTATPAQHFSGRGIADANRTLWASWVIESDALRVFFSGDSGYFSGFADIGQRFGPFDLTLMETGGYCEQWSYVHMRPQETVQAHIDLRGRWLLPIHNGTFDLAMHSWTDPLDQVSRIAKARGITLTTPAMGERLDLHKPHSFDPWWESSMTAPTTSPDTRRHNKGCRCEHELLDMRRMFGNLNVDRQG